MLAYIVTNFQCLNGWHCLVDYIEHYNKECCLQYIQWNEELVPEAGISGRDK